MVNLKMDKSMDNTDALNGVNIKQVIVLMVKKKEKKLFTQKMEIFHMNFNIKMVKKKENKFIT